VDGVAGVRTAVGLFILGRAVLFDEEALEFVVGAGAAAGDVLSPAASMVTAMTRSELREVWMEASAVRLPIRMPGRITASAFGQEAG
jgi:hypothetical protein